MNKEVQEYIAGVSSERFQELVHDLARQDFERLFACGDIAVLASEEFNNDVIELLEQEAREKGIGVSDDEDES